MVSMDLPVARRLIGAVNIISDLSLLIVYYILPTLIAFKCRIIFFNSNCDRESPVGVPIFTAGTMKGIAM
jgi:hypothetical protein